MYNFPIQCTKVRLGWRVSCPFDQEQLGHNWPIVILLSYKEPTVTRNLQFNAKRQSTQFYLSQTGTEWFFKVCLKAYKYETRRKKGKDTNTRQTQTCMPEPGLEPCTLHTTVDRLPAASWGPAGDHTKVSNISSTKCSTFCLKSYEYMRV